ncbi:FtsX-like permease family protein [Draconibacterium sp. IB214405]|uniref:ABC transporter permease n=1 Tax=Draconibacterium sp. IB214405 TaxID=3097352 RepID=UPI002A0C5BA8|nr:ABC transporter permease [Draconibacterium sp. IB214405]MDX8339090.1 FtsX-like permease family protein [Draconibacterium sp. IB214405]
MSEFKRNLKLGWRNILKNKFFSFLNIGGVAIGIAVTTLILFWVVDELSYDKFNDNLAQMYQVYEHQVYSDGQDLHTGCTPFPLSNELKQTYPEIENATTFTNLGGLPVKYETTEYKDISLTLADKEFMNIFSFDLIEGELNAIEAPDKILITPKIAQLFFPNESAIGKPLTIYGNYTLTVGAIIDYPKEHSSTQFDILASVKLAEQLGADLTRWGNNWPFTCLLLTKGTDANELESKLTGFLKEKGQENTSIYLFPYAKRHLYTFSGENNRIQYIYQFLAIAIIIVLIASINFVNSSTASSETRRPEVGIRKVLGATKANLTSQFFHEKGLMIIISIVLGAALVLAFTPLFGQVSDKQISLLLLGNKYLIIMLAAMILTTLILSVAYPSLYISSFAPARVLKKAARKSSNRVSFRSLLVVVQFTLSIILIICTIAVNSQLKFINNYDLGYNRDNLVYINLDQATKTKHEALTSTFRNISGVANITKADKLPFWGGNSSWGYDWQGKDPENKVLICEMHVDREYFETLGITLAEGQSFSPATDLVEDEDRNYATEVILNQEAIRRMKMTEPIEKYFGRNGSDRARIVGVAKDFHFESLRSGIEPMVITPLRDNPDVLIFRIRPENFSQTIAEIKESWKTIIPDSNIELGFFDQRLQQMYNSEERISGLFRYFSFIAIFIACIGLFGLSVFAIERKRKEIGIRKVNGSKVSQILAMLNKDFIKWVLISFIIASPLAWYVMNSWLQNFAYQTELHWWIFALAGILSIAIAVLTVSIQSYKAATRNPVEALRYE